MSRIVSASHLVDGKAFLKKLKSSKAKNLIVKFTIPTGEFCQTSIWIESLKESDLTKGIPVSGVFEGVNSLVESDAVLRLDPSTLRTEIAPIHLGSKSVIGIGSLHKPNVVNPVNPDPRHVASKANEALKQSGIGDECLIGPELEFSVFDDVTFDNSDGASFHRIREAEYKKNEPKTESSKLSAHPMGLMPLHYLPEHKDTLFDVRSKILENLESFGYRPRSHLHEDNQGQCEVVIEHDSLVRMADYTQIAKLSTFQVAKSFDKVASFMPFPFTGRPGNGHHVNISIWKEGVNIFANTNSNGLSDEARYFAGGILKHSKALNCICNPSINSYRRLAAHFNIYQALALAENNRTTAIRVPAVSNPKNMRLEIRFPDNTANPYYSYSALLLAGLDGIKNKTNPDEVSRAPKLSPPFSHEFGFARDLYEAASCLHEDREFLKCDGVFDDGLIDFLCHKAILLSQQGLFTTAPLDFEQSFSL